MAEYVDFLDKQISSNIHAQETPQDFVGFGLIPVLGFKLAFERKAKPYFVLVPHFHFALILLKPSFVFDES